MSAGNNAILSEAELAAALAEVEQLSTAEKQIPSLEEPVAAAAVLVPVPNLQNDLAAAVSVTKTPRIIAPPEPAAPPSPAIAVAPPAMAAAAPAAPANVTKPPTVAPPPATPAETTPDASVKRRSLGQIFYGAIDSMLDWINWPFVRLGDSVRGMIGALSAVTLVTSLLAIAILPLLHPDRDPLGFLKRRPPPAPAAAADGGHGAAPKGDTHGGGH